MSLLISRGGTIFFQLIFIFFYIALEKKTIWAKKIPHNQVTAELNRHFFLNNIIDLEFVCKRTKLIVINQVLISQFPIKKRFYVFHGLSRG